MAAVRGPGDATGPVELVVTYQAGSVSVVTASILCVWRDTSTMANGFTVNPSHPLTLFSNTVSYGNVSGSSVNVTRFDFTST
jgi:hypothetical protein